VIDGLPGDSPGRWSQGSWGGLLFALLFGLAAGGLLLAMLWYAANTFD
jgi:hypothetical protein